YFHYRNLDVSTLKELCRRWKPELLKGLAKEGKHEALADVYESIEELRYYRRNFLRERRYDLLTLAREQDSVTNGEKARVNARVVSHLLVQAPQCNGIF